MAQKRINLELLLQVLFWVPHKYSDKPQEVKDARPIRGYLEGDGAMASTLIKTIRKARRCQIKAWKEGRRSEPDFETLKKLVVNSLQWQHGWSRETRNYLSSVASTYITWDYHGQSEENRRVVADITESALRQHDPNGKLRRILNA